MKLLIGFEILVVFLLLILGPILKKTENFTLGLSIKIGFFKINLIQYQIRFFAYLILGAKKGASSFIEGV